MPKSKSCGQSIDWYVYRKSKNSRTRGEGIMKEIFDAMREELETLKKLIMKWDEREVKRECASENVIKTENEKTNGKNNEYTMD